MELLGVSGEDKEKITALVDQVAKNLRFAVEDMAVPQSEREFSVQYDNRFQTTVTNGAAGRGNQGFSFWGDLNLEGLFQFPELRDIPYAAIKDLRIPLELQKQGWARKVVETWEKSFQELGITRAAAFNIQQASIGFWENLGYQKSANDDKHIPYCMVKDITADPSDTQD